MAKNGVVHTIDCLCIPSTITMPALPLADAANAGGYTTWYKMMWAVGLVDDVNDLTKHITCFVPTNAAFSALPPQTMNWLMSSPGLLTKVMMRPWVGFGCGNMCGLCRIL